jgi:hypothetical protein
MLTRIIPPSKDANWQTGLKRKIQQSAAYRRPITWTETSLAEGKKLEEDLPSQWPLKTGRGSNTYLRQSRL